MKSYIITEEQLNQIKGMIYHEDEIPFERIMWKIVSNPYQIELRPDLEPLPRVIR